MNCARCTKPIRPDEETEGIQNLGASGAGAEIVVHARLCPRAPQQTAPTPRR